MIELSTPALNVEAIREDFPLLKRQIHGKTLVYLDNAATTQKPQVMIDRTSRFYSEEYGTVRRGVYELSAWSTQAFEAVRQQTAQFINASRPEEIIFVRGTTEAINLVAFGFGMPFIGPGDQVLITAIEHHANIVPWQQICSMKGAILAVAPVDDNGDVILEEYEKRLTDRTKIVAIAHVSNALGTVNPIKQMIAMAHAKGIPVLIDGAQGIAHGPVDVQDLDCDFYAFSGHKIYGPTGVGVLYGKYNLLDKMIPYQCGGDMIETVTFDKTTFAKPPAKFEAGTPAIAQVIGLGASLEYLQNLGMDRLFQHDQAMLQYATEQLKAIEGLRIIGTAKEKAAVISFVVEDIHPHDMASILDQEAIAIRAGHHCAQPVMERFNVPATSRASFAIYNTREEVDKLAAGIQKAIEVFR